MTSLRRLLVWVAAQRLAIFVVPDAELARNSGINLAAIEGLELVATPRHASILLIVGPVPPGLARASAVTYSQMPRPRWILAVGTTQVEGLPEPDLVIRPDQVSLVDGIAELRRIIADSSFRPDAASFALEAVRTRTVFVCPMHPQIVQETPGSCPICGMALVPEEISEEAIPQDSVAEHEQTASPAPDAHGPTGDGTGSYTCPMHPEIIRDEPGNCPICGMTHETEYTANAVSEHAGHQMGNTGDMGEHLGHAMGETRSAMDHSSHAGGGFMSMIEITKDLPRSRDGLPMDWIDVPFGPLFPGLPGGLALKLTLDGDTVATADIRHGATSRELEETWPGAPETLHERIASLDRLAPCAYSALAWEAMARADGAEPDEAGQRARVGVLERARTISHLGWLTAFGRLLGYRWLATQAAALHQAVVHAVDASDLTPIRDDVRRLIARIERTPMLHQRLSGIGVIPANDYGDWLTGPVARAGGLESDVRMDDPAYHSFGFVPVTRDASDALARLEVRIHEVVQSLDLLKDAGTWILPAPSVSPNAAEARARLEMPRGEGSIQVVLNQREVGAVNVSAPSTMHVDMLPVVAEGIELADSLVSIASLDISPWEIDQ